MKYRIHIHIDVDARNQQQAVEWAGKIGELLKHPMTRMSIEGEGIRLAGGDGRPVVYQPQPELGP